MKKTIILLITFTFISCGKSKKNEVRSEVEKCNHVEFYRISEERKTMAWNDTINNHQVLQDILTNNENLNLSSSEVLNVLSKDFIKYSVTEDACDDILDEFTGWKIPEIKFWMEACAPTYRDILVFKNDNKVIGFAKVCFTCSQNYLVVNNVVGENIDLDYEDLKEILDKLASS